MGLMQRLDTAHTLAKAEARARVAARERVQTLREAMDLIDAILDSPWPIADMATVSSIEAVASTMDSTHAALANLKAVATERLR